MNFRNWLKKLRKIHWLIISICALIIICGIVYYQDVSASPAIKSFNKAFNYYLTGDCDKYSEAYFIDIPQNYGGDAGDSIYEKQSEISDRCKTHNENNDIFGVSVLRASRTPFSDTTFIQAKITEVNDNGVHHDIPQSFTMKKEDGYWMIYMYYDPNK